VHSLETSQLSESFALLLVYSSFILCILKCFLVPKIDVRLTPCSYKDLTTNTHKLSSLFCTSIMLCYTTI